ncbi:MAG: SUMF1/EgtB/PvdO family nonheme iron enzyme [Almyronema sp.]
MMDASSPLLRRSASHAVGLETDPIVLRSHLEKAYAQCRADTLALVAHLDEATFYQQAHPDFSPIGWHLGHIGFTESLWILENLAQQPCAFPQYRRLFAADGLPKAERQNLPDLPTLLSYLSTIRDQVLSYLAIAPLAQQGRLWHWLLQHESQHYETMAMVLALHRGTQAWETPTPLTAAVPLPACRIPAGSFQMGYDGLAAIDNEKLAHTVDLDEFYLDAYPVTQGDYQQFIAAQGYQSPTYWSAAGWEWLQQAQVSQPLYWRWGDGWQTVPVCGVSWYEAEAYTRFVGKRLPTEAEWEKAMRLHSVAEVTLMEDGWGDRTSYNGSDHQKPDPLARVDLTQSLGQVWEWTASWFAEYEGFCAYPYPGYSQVYFDGQHRVLRGSSWATRPWVRRLTFRNWYHPHVRQVFVGFRCVSDKELAANG